MDTKREDELFHLKSYIDSVDKEVTMILQSLQWDRKQLLEGPPKVHCKYDPTHRVPPDKKEAHEKDCYLKKHGYSTEDRLLPDPVDPEANTLVKLSTEDIKQIINYASQTDPLFKKGSQGSEPLTVGRLQATYTRDERRAIYDAVVSAVPACHDLADLALPSSYGVGERAEKTRSRAEILSELRNMRRRRAKYRVAAKTTKYSDVLRDVIKTQMELYSEVPQETKPQFTDSGKIPKLEPGESSSNYIDNDTKRNIREHSKDKNSETRSNKMRNFSYGSKKCRKDDRGENSMSKSKYANEFETKRDKYNSYTYDKEDHTSYKERNKDENDRTYEKTYHREDRGENSRSRSKYANEFETKRDKYNSHTYNKEDYRSNKDRNKDENDRIYDKNYYREDRGENSRSKSKYANEFETKRDKYNSHTYNKEDYRSNKDRNKDENDRIYDKNYYREDRGENSRSKSKHSNSNEFENKRNKYRGKIPTHNEEEYRSHRDGYKKGKQRDSRSNERRRYNNEYEKDRKETHY